jgi:hypothetical protein
MEKRAEKHMPCLGLQPAMEALPARVRKREKKKSTDRMEQKSA